MRISDGSSDVCSSDLPFGELRDALDLVGDGAELFVECDVREFFGVLGQRLLLILFPEEARVGEARGEDLAVRSEEHTSELQPLMRRSNAVFCLKKQMQTPD